MERLTTHRIYFRKKRWRVSQQAIFLAPYDLHTYGKLL